MKSIKIINIFNMTPKELYKKINICIENYYENQKISSDKRVYDKKDLMNDIIPLLKYAQKLEKEELKKTKEVFSKNPYLRGILEGYSKSSGLSIRSTNVTKIHSLCYDIRDYVSYWINRLES